MTKNLTLNSKSFLFNKIATFNNNFEGIRNDINNKADIDEFLSILK